LTSGGLEDL